MTAIHNIIMQTKNLLHQTTREYRLKSKLAVVSHI